MALPSLKLRLFVTSFITLALTAFAADRQDGQISDRDQDGLRGAVKKCTEETTRLPIENANVADATGWKSSYQTEFDVAGHRVLTLNRNSDGSEWKAQYTYDASGNLLRTVQSDTGKPDVTTTYIYDSQHRLTKIAYGDRPESPVTFMYDEHGRKTKLQISRAEDYRQNVASDAGSPFASADMPPNLQGGGTATTAYDDENRPVQVKVTDSQGALMSRSVRIYDEQGHIAEEKQILDDPLNIFPADVRAAISQQSGATGENVREQLKNLMGGQPGMNSVANVYDQQGRIKQKTERFFNQVNTIETTYTENGDVAVETTRNETAGSEIGRGESQTQGITEYKYEYDQHRNWTSKTDLLCKSPGEGCEVTMKVQRTLTYF